MNNQTSSRTRLWFRQPATEWLQALPVGNGRLGAMVFGQAPVERIQLNEETIWVGEPSDRVNPLSPEYLAEVRALLAAGDYAAAEEIAAARMMSLEPRLQPYQTLGDLVLTFEGHDSPSDYARDLELATGVATTRYRVGDCVHTREVLASAVDDVIAVRLGCSQPGHLNCRIELDREADAVAALAGPACLALRGRLAGRGLRFEARVQVLASGGVVTADGLSLVVAAADEVVLLVAAASDYRGGDPGETCAMVLSAAASQSWSALAAAATADHARLFGRVSLDLGGHRLSGLPTDERLDRLRDGEDDPDLAALCFQFGRYLLLASSRPGCLPANLQGLWNDRLEPPWNCDYHTNINLEMNYWPAETCGLPECAQPLFDWLASLVEPGSDTAERMYGCRGWTLHHVSDIHGYTTPADSVRTGLWPTGGIWLCQHLWEHDQFHDDPTFREFAYPLLKGAAEFLLDFLTADAKGKLVVGPSVSPENRFLDGQGEPHALTMGCALDQQLARDLFWYTAMMAAALGRDEGFREQLLDARQRFAPDRIGRHGQLQEWAIDHEEAEPGHRHLSHLYGLFPGSQFTLETTPELAAAASISLERRLAHGSGQTGWSRAWCIALWARLGDGELAGESLEELLRKNLASNLLDLHPPGIFQLDGNCGATAAIAEMLLQSHAGYLHLLPALPPGWSHGWITGLRGRAGFTVDLAWDEGQLSAATIVAEHDGPCRFRASLLLAVTRHGQAVETSTEASGVQRFTASAGSSYELAPA